MESDDKQWIGNSIYEVLIYSINNEMFYGLRLASRNVSLVKL